MFLCFFETKESKIWDCGWIPSVVSDSNLFPKPCVLDPVCLATSAPMIS